MPILAGRPPLQKLPGVLLQEQVRGGTGAAAEVGLSVAVVFEFVSPAVEQLRDGVIRHACYL